MFVWSEETRTFWVNPLSSDSAAEFRLVGLALGLAIYSGVILDVHFAPVVYKKLLGRPAVAFGVRHVFILMQQDILGPI
jgi:ubiquitin-protein ligase E3 A